MNGIDYKVKCVFQIWKRRDIERSIIVDELEEGFQYTKKKENADISIRRVGFYAGKSWRDTNKSDQSHYFIVLDDKSKVDLLIEYLNSFSWNNDLTVGPRSISKGEINSVINSFL
jgi:hypothetical protein